MKQLFAKVVNWFKRLFGRVNKQTVSTAAKAVVPTVKRISGAVKPVVGRTWAYITATKARVAIFTTVTTAAVVAPVAINWAMSNLAPVILTPAIYVMLL